MGCINSTNKTLCALKRDNIFNVSIIRVEAHQTMALARHGLLEITAQELIFVAPDHEPVAWALQHLRRYGLTGNVFSFEAGRRCPTGPGIYTFRCCNAAQFYVKFQSCINSMTINGDRSNISTHPSQLFRRLESHQPHVNHYLEPTSVQVTAPLEESVLLPGTLGNNSNELNLNSPDSFQSTSLNADIIHFPSSMPSYSNVGQNTDISSNIYMKQPIRIVNEHNNNISAHDIIDSFDSNHKSIVRTLLNSSSLDVPPDECAPILNTNTLKTQKLYENVDACIIKSSNTFQHNCNSSERSYSNIEFLPKCETPIGQSKSQQLDMVAEQQQMTNTSNPIVNYIILDLDQPRSPSHCSPKNESGSVQSLSECRGNITNFTNDHLPTTTSALSCGSFTMPKGSTIRDVISKTPNNKIESFGSYTRIDFLKTFALMKSSTNYTDLDIENDQESRITRHSKFVRKAYSISE